MSSERDQYGLRDSLGKPSKTEVNQVLSNEYRKWRKTAINTMVQNKDLVLQELTKVKNLYSDRVVSLPSLCMVYLISVEGKSLAPRMNMKPREYRFASDFYMTYRGVLASITIAEHAIANSPSEIASQVIESASDSKQSKSLADEAENYLKYVESYDKYARLLKSDPTGITLLKDRVKDASNREDSDDTPYAGEYIVEGAKFALDMYRTVYPIAKTLYQDQPQNKS